MFVKPISENLNPGPYLPPPTSIYTCRVTTAPKMRSKKKKKKLKLKAKCIL